VINSNENKIRKIIENWAKAVRKKDLNGILANHSNDIIMFDVPMPFQSNGIEAYRKTWETFFQGTQEGQFDIKDLKVIAGKDVAFCIAIMMCSWNNKGKFEDLDFRLTIGLKKLEGNWTIVHEHHSVPAE
jgi:uncharacterized protein (TIGR02246 family)